MVVDSSNHSSNVSSVRGNVLVTAVQTSPLVQPLPSLAFTAGPATTTMPSLEVLGTIFFLLSTSYETK
jgi:hypothetical protein